ncbi:hypothetical protein BJ684DRAFT_18062, partial [Piptocephalis cylindrospora]
AEEEKLRLAIDTARSRALGSATTSDIPGESEPPPLPASSPISSQTLSSSQIPTLPHELDRGNRSRSHTGRTGTEETDLAQTDEGMIGIEKIDVEMIDIVKAVIEMIGTMRIDIGMIVASSVETQDSVRAHCICDPAPQLNMNPTERKDVHPIASVAILLGPDPGQSPRPPAKTLTAGMRQVETGLYQH